MPSCEIILATYNGERYIGALLDSLLDQNTQDFSLLVRDDGSRDSTVALLNSFKLRFGSRMRLMPAGVATGSPTRNFAILMAETTADFILFCDQDDVWLPNRVAATVELLTLAERQHGKDCPVFAFNDLIPVDAALKPLSDSFWRFKKIAPGNASNLAKSILTTSILGCSSGINRALAQKSLPISPKATNHDWWALHVAALFGAVVWSAEKTVLYRLHGSNASNQTKVSWAGYLKRRDKSNAVKRGLIKKSEHVGGLLSAYEETMPHDKKMLLQAFCNLQNLDFIKRRFSILRWGFLYPDALRSLLFLIKV